MKIITDYIYPPIPLRSFDWMATTEDYDGGDPIGFGQTEDEAVADLIAQLEDWHSDRKFYQGGLVEDLTQPSVARCRHAGSN